MIVYGVLLVSVSSRGIVRLMLCVFNQAHATSPEGKKKIIIIIIIQKLKINTLKNFFFAFSSLDLVLINLYGVRTGMMG